MPFSEEELVKIKGELPRGASEKLAEQFAMNTKSIRRILNGVSNNDDVIIAAFELAKNHQAKIADVKKALANA